MWIGPWLAFINNILNYFGTYLLLVPLTIVITSLLYDQSKALNVIATLFGVAGGLIALIKGMYLGTLQEYFNLKIFVVYHALALEKKRELFVTAYTKFMYEESKGVIETMNYLKGYLDDKYFIVYDEVLKLLPVTEIPLYARREILSILELQKAVEDTNSNILTKMSNGISDIASYVTMGGVIKTLVVIGCITGGILFIRWLSIDMGNALKTGAILQNDAANIGKKGVVLTSALAMDTQMLDNI